jgi:hypothetical protein
MRIHSTPPTEEGVRANVRSLLAGRTVTELASLMDVEPTTLVRFFNGGDIPVRALRTLVVAGCLTAAFLYEDLRLIGGFFDVGP